jgi:outer membrane lipoprotein-sorting protein
MRRIVFPSLFAALILAVACPAPSRAAGLAHQGAGPVAPHFSDAEKAELKRVSVYLNGIQSVEGRFLQIAGNGKSEQGMVYLKKPGRIRFEYQKPNPNLIIADGTTVAVQNSDLHTTDRYPLLNSPLRLLLSENVDLSNDPRISAVKHEQGVLSITARENAGAAIGAITLNFADSGGAGLELRQWEVVDAQGSRTTIVISDVHQVADIPARLFVIQDLSPFKKN